MGVQLFEHMAAKVEQTDPGFQNPLGDLQRPLVWGGRQCVALLGEKLREMMAQALSKFIETANEDAENAVLVYLEARTAFGGRY